MTTSASIQTQPMQPFGLEVLRPQPAGCRHRVLARQHLGTNRAVEQAGVEVREAEMLGHRLRDRPLARRRRAVDCHREAHAVKLML